MVLITSTPTTFFSSPNLTQPSSHQVLDWLKSKETQVSRLQPVAVDLDAIKQQQDELRPLAKEYRDYAVTIEKVRLLRHY